jgi:hypothetical protein
LKIGVARKEKKRRGGDGQVELSMSELGQKKMILSVKI